MADGLLTIEEVQASLGIKGRLAEAAARMPLAYVSGPYRHKKGTAYVEMNIRKAEATAQALWQMGFSVICPHTNTRHFDGLCEPEVWLAGDLVMVEKADCLVMVGGWQYSSGATLEWEHGLAKGKKVFYWPESMAEMAEYAKTFKR